MKKLAPFFLLLLLAACQTPEQVAEQKRLQEQEDFNTCVSYGLRPKSEAFGNCRLQLDLARKQMRYNDRYDYPPYYYHPHIGSPIYYVR